jgi:uncharacterized protein (DUF58 family)
MRRAWVVLFLSLASLAGALVTGRDLYYHLAYVLVGMLVVSALWAWSAMRGLRLGRHTREHRAQVGRFFEETFSLSSTSRLPKLWVVVRDGSDLPGHRASRVVHGLRAGSDQSWTARTLCEQRGRFRLGPVTITSSDPLGLFEFRRFLPQTRSIVVYPATVSMLSFPHPASLLPGGDALRRRTHYVTTNAAGVRDYAPGDGLNRIHWRSTARKSRLIVKEFELDPLMDVWILIDLQESAQAAIELDEATRAIHEMQPLWRRAEELRLQPSTEEYVVTAAASVAEYFIRRRRSVGLVGYGQRRELIQADRDERQLGKILDTLAVLRAEGDMPFGEMLRAEGGRLARGSVVVAISPALRWEWVEAAQYLNRTGLRVVPIMVDASTFSRQPGADPFIDRMKAAGMPAIRVGRDAPISESLGNLPQTRRRHPLPRVYAAMSAAG